MAAELKRASGTITFRLQELDRTALDWSAWDDSYRFIRDRNQPYIQSNMPDKAISGIDVHLMLFLDTENRPVFSKWVSLETQQEVAAPKGLFEALIPVTTMLKNRPVTEGLRGIIMLPDGRPLMLAARPIISSAFSGPARGTFIVGRILDQPLIEHLRKQTQLDMQLHTGTKGLSLHQKQRITPLDGQRIRGEHLLSDILGTPILTLQLDSKRSIYLLGQKSARDVALSLLLSGSLIGIALFMYGEKGIVRHLIRMSNKADEIAQSGDTSQRLEICGAPELQRLGSAVNNMLESLEQAHREIQESEQKHRTVLQQSSDAIILYDPALERIIDANQAFYRMTGYEAEDLPFLSPLQLLLNQQRLATVVRIARQRDRLHLTDVHCRCKNGSVLEMDVAASLLTIGGRELLSAILRDMTERNREQRMIKEIAITDVLTGIPNRRYLLERAEQEFERLKRHQNRQTDNCTLGCIMLDVDYFKAINDTHGHQCGDTVLAELARRVGISVRPYDIIGRYGGEEFAVFLTDTTGDQTMIVATRIWQTIRSAPYYFDAHVFPVTASLGISWMKQDDQSVDDILKRADAALYQAKEKGRDRIEA